MIREIRLVPTPPYHPPNFARIETNKPSKMAKGSTSTTHVVITMEGKQALDFMKQLQQ